MARSHGKDTYFSVDDSGGTLQQMVGVDNVTGLPGAAGLSEVTAFTDDGERFIRGLEGLTFTVSGTADAQATTGNLTVLNGNRTKTTTSSFEYGPQGNGSGAVKYSGECWLENFTVDSAVKDATKFSATFRLDNAITVGTF